MTVRLLAAFLWSASLDIPRPAFHRYELARRDLLRAMRETRVNWLRSPGPC